MGKLLEAFAVQIGETVSTPTYRDIARIVRERILNAHDEERHVLQPSRVKESNFKRRQRMAERRRWYRNECDHDISALIDIVFDHPRVKEQRKRLAELAKAHNISQRIVNEVSALYDCPAEREFSEDETRTSQLRELEKSLELHDLLQQAHRLTNLCNETLILCIDEPRVFASDSFDPITEPSEPLMPIGFVVDWAPTTSSTDATRLKVPHFLVVDDEVVVELNLNGHYLQHYPHNRGRLPAVLAHREKPIDELMDNYSGSDILACHKAVALLNLLTVRLALSQGEKQPILMGDTARMAAGQAFEGSQPVVLPPGTSIEMLQSISDPDHLIKALKHFVSGTAASYGLTYEMLMRESQITSGLAFRLARQKLIEIRRQQAKRWRVVEREVVELLGFDASNYT